jgi:hypothetical protein
LQKTINNPNSETFISAIILLVLALIAAGIFLKQASFYPSVTLNLTGPSHLASPAVKSLIPLPPDLQPLSAMEAFDPANLSDKINGKAELYLSAGFRRLQSQRYHLAAQPGIWAEAFIYDMGVPANAFAVFSTQKRTQSQPAAFGDDAYQTANALFFVHGPYYVEIVGATVANESRLVIQQLAKAFIAGTPIQPAASLDDKDLFPEAYLASGSIALQSQNVFGFDQLDHIYTAQYDIDGSELTAFLSRRSSADEAQKLAGAYLNFLLTFGGNQLKTDMDLPGLQVISIMGAFEMVFASGPYLAGIHEAESLEMATKLVYLLHARLQEAGGER